MQAVKSNFLKPFLAFVTDCQPIAEKQIQQQTILYNDSFAQTLYTTNPNAWNLAFAPLPT